MKPYFLDFGGAKVLVGFLGSVWLVGGFAVCFVCGRLADRSGSTCPWSG